jgi:hypothetical protein
MQRSCMNGMSQDQVRPDYGRVQRRWSQLANYDLHLKTFVQTTGRVRHARSTVVSIRASRDNATDCHWRTSKRRKRKPQSQCINNVAEWRGILAGS